MEKALRMSWLAGLLLAAVTILVYWPAVSHDFINLDDPDFVTANTQVQRGLTWEGVVWAFRPGHGDYWHPLAWLSHMLDVQLFGKSPAGPHGVNVLFHAANAVLLFLLLRRLTGAQWKSAMVAALFALHPLRVESVAWVSERKDVLSTLFALLTLWTYARYVGESKVRGPKSRAFYVLSLACFALGLMTKAMLVTLPFVMLLLDYWPLMRMPGVRCQVSGVSTDCSDVTPDTSHPTPCWRLVWEKIPFFAFSAGACLMTYLTAKTAVDAIVGLPVETRMETAAVAFVWYLGKAIWPVGLAPMYPHPGQWPMLSVAVSGVVLVGLSLGAVTLARKRPYVFTGWCWYLGTLVPVIGLVQVGAQWVADRFTYVPLIGVFIVLVWGAAKTFAHWRLPRAATVLMAGLVLAAYAIRTRDQLGYWQNTESLFTHALNVTRNNVIAHNLLGGALLAKGQSDQAEAQYLEALQIQPHHAYTLANLGDFFAEKGKMPEAQSYLEAALQIEPHLASAHASLGRVLISEGQLEAGIAHYREALRLKPDLIEILNNLAWILATCPEAKFRAGAQAVQLAEQACELTGYQTAYTVGTLAAAYAEAGRFGEAVATSERARTLALAAGQLELANRNTRLLELYRADQAYREVDAMSINRSDLSSPPAHGGATSDNGLK